MTTPTPTHPRRHPDTSFRRIGDEGGLVVLPGRAEVKVLNPAAIQIFAMLDGKHSAEEIASAVASEFEVAYESALADLQAFLSELQQHGMLAVEAEA